LIAFIYVIEYGPGTHINAPEVVAVCVGGGDVKVYVTGIVDEDVLFGENATHGLAQVIALGVNTAVYGGTKMSL
jgi:hypothetical protein